MRRLFLILALCITAVAQQPQTTNPISAVNARYQQGVGTGFWPTAGAGLTLNIAAGTAVCNGTIVTYAGGTLTMANTTNNVYLTPGTCTPAVKTTAFTIYDIPIAVVTAAAGSITSILDVRTMFGVIVPPSAGGGSTGICATLNALAIYIGTTSLGCGNADFTYATHTLTGGASSIFDISAATGTAAFKLPVNAGNTATAAGALDYDSIGSNIHGYTGGADHIMVAAAITPVNGDCPVWLESGGNVLLGDNPGPCPSGTVTGTGTPNNVTKWTGASSIGDASTTDDGTIVDFNLPISPLLGTAGVGGVTQNLLAALDTSNPGRYVLPTSANCGVGIAATTATVGNTFRLLSMTGEDYIGIADNTITAGNLLGGGTSAVGRVKDLGQTQITAVPTGTCIVGKALGSATVGNPVHLFYLGLGTWGTNGQISGSGTAGVIPHFNGPNSINNSDFDNTVSNVMRSASNLGQTAVTYQGGEDVNANAALGGVTLRGADMPGGGGASSQGGTAVVRGGNNTATNTASKAGSVEIQPGISTGATQGLQGLLTFVNAFVKGGGTSTQWNLQCFTGATMTVNDCGASPSVIAGVADTVGANTVEVHTLGSETPINASAPVTLNHTVCAGTSAGQVTDSGGTAPCTTGFTVGTVIDVSNSYKLGDGVTFTASTTLPLVQMVRTQAVGNAANGIAGVVAPIADTAGVISLQNSAAANVTSASGNGTIVVITTGAQTSGASVKIDANGNHIAGSTTQPYDISITYGKPNAGEWRIDAGVRTVNFAANFSGSQGTCFTNPTAAVTFTIWAANFGVALTSATQLGTASVSTSCVFTFTSVGGTSKSYASGQYLAVQAPVIADPNMQGIAIKLAGTRATQ